MIKVKFLIAKKKATSLKEIKYESLELEGIQKVKDLFIALTLYEYNKQNIYKRKVLSLEDISQQAYFGKVTFSLYNHHDENLFQAIETMFQDFQDGLFKVFINQKEYTDMEANIDLLEENKVIFIQLVMMAGRLW